MACVNPCAGGTASTDGRIAGDSPVVLPLKEVGKAAKEWTLTLQPTHLALAESPGAQPYVILRDQLMKTAMLNEGLRVLIVTKPVKASFKLPTESVQALAEWVGKPFLASFYLKRRYAWVLPMAVLWIISSLPMPGSSEAGGRSVPLDPVGLGLGLALIGSWACAKFRPHPALFLVDSLWFLGLGGYLVVEVANGRNKFWLLFVAFSLWLVVSGLKHFVRFRGVRLALP